MYQLQPAISYSCYWELWSVQRLWGWDSVNAGILCSVFFQSEHLHSFGCYLPPLQHMTGQGMLPKFGDATLSLNGPYRFPGSPSEAFTVGHSR